MSESINEKLAQLNADALKRISELEKMVRDARNCHDPAACVLCSPGNMCGPHKQLRSLSELDHVKEVTRLRDIEQKYDALVKKHEELASSIPALISEAVAALPELQEELADMNEFVISTAKRLGIHPDGSLDRVRSRISDAIRKLNS